MLFSFKIKKPNDIDKTLENLKKRVTEYGGKMKGNTEKGAIAYNGVEGKYVVGETAIVIKIMRKPSFLVPNVLIENEIRNIFNEVKV